MRRSPLAILLLAPVLAIGAAATPPSTRTPSCGVEDALLRARLRGALNADIDWRGTALECEGMPRPAGAGMRVRFRGSLPDGRALAVVFASPALAPGAQDTDLPVNVTLIVEDTGRIYGTQGSDRCRLDSVRQDELAAPAAGTHRYRIEGRGYCTAPAAAIGGGDGVLLNRFDFVGLVDVLPDDLPAPAEATTP